MLAYWRLKVKPLLYLRNVWNIKWIVSIYTQWMRKQTWLHHDLKKRKKTLRDHHNLHHLLCSPVINTMKSHSTEINVSLKQAWLKSCANRKVSEQSLGGFTLHYISANVHVGSNIEHIPQDKHTHQKNWGLRKFPSGLVRVCVDANDVTLWNTWAMVSRAHINKATLARLGSRSLCRCQCAESHGLPALVLLGTDPHDLELLPKLMNTPCVLIAWIESHDPDVKKVRFTHLHLRFTYGASSETYTF